nr:2OG-Fe(II) oxygenase [Bowmanella dokdonensis]
MQRVNFGRGQYRYFAYPLPEGIQRLREAFYRKLVPVANHWAQCLGLDRHWPSTLGEFLRENHLQGQQLPTPLMLDYGPGDYNCLHQDKYGEAFFPFQVLIQLNRPGKDFTGGEFVLVENQARRQSRVMVVPLSRGQAVVFPNSLGVQRSSRGYSRTQIRHGVSQIMTGHRRSLGLIFHDALK